MTARSTSATMREQADRSLELARRFGLAIINDPSLLDDIPDGVNLVLVAADDLTLAEMKIEIGLAAVRRGEDVSFRHIRLADLPVKVEQRVSGDGMNLALGLFQLQRDSAEGVWA
ncbi:MAG: hypothetical protein ACRDJH_00540 [Thermomicrobiales bacterium]